MRQKISPLARPEFIHLGIVGRAFRAAVPRIIIIVAVAVLFAIRVVVLVIVADQIVQRKTVVRGNEVDAGVGPTAAMLIQIRTAREAIGNFADLAFIAFPKTPDLISILPVPLRPEDRKIAHLIAAVPNVPRLRDQLGLGEHRVLVNDFEKGVEFVHPFLVAGKGRCQIETEAIHVHIVHPVPQAIHHELERTRMEEVERVPGPGEIHVVPGVFRRQSVIGGVIHPSKTQSGAQVIPFRGVIVNHIQDHLDAGRVQIAHHAFELGDLFAHYPAAGIFRLRSEETDRVVTPVIDQAAIDQNLDRRCADAPGAILPR